MSDLITTAQDRCLEAYVVAEGFMRDLVQRARDNRGQTAAEYMGVLLVVSVIIAGVSQTHIGDQIVEKMKSLISAIASGDSGKD
jgi:Flp pilus assembly pilin Flp